MQNLVNYINNGKLWVVGVSSFRPLITSRGTHASAYPFFFVLYAYSAYSFLFFFTRILRKFDYNDYYDDYYDYDYPGDDVFARIVKAVKKNKKERKSGRIDPKKILLDSVQENFEFPKDLLDALPDIDDVEYEDFETLNEQVESLDRVKRRRKN